MHKTVVMVVLADIAARGLLLYAHEDVVMF